MPRETTVVQQETVHCSRDQLFASATDQGLCLDCAPVAVDHPGFICEDGKLVPSFPYMMGDRFAGQLGENSLAQCSTGAAGPGGPGGPGAGG